MNNEDLQNLKRVASVGNVKAVNVDAPVLLALIERIESLDAPAVANGAAIPKWIDDQKGKDPLMDDMIAYIEIQHRTVLGAVATTKNANDTAVELLRQLDEARAAIAASTQQAAPTEVKYLDDDASEKLRAEYPGIAGEFKVFDVLITTELDCKLGEGEYGIDICELVNGCVGEHDFGRIEDAVHEVVDTLGLPDEGQTVVRVYESGEREDVYWNSYWRVVNPGRAALASVPTAP